ncbi:MAG: copper-translocating P-type ATPase [Candidatus Odinarchaeia archaeon]
MQKTKHSKMQHKKHGDHSEHIKDFKIRFFISLILTIPVLILSDTIQLWLGYVIDFPFRRVVILILATIIYAYGGWPFLKGAYKEIKKKQPGMMMLISLAISVAYFYSAATVLIIPGGDFFWELATLIDVMLLGHWIEAKSIMGASRALEELVRVMPVNAHLIKDKEIIEVKVSELKPGDIVLVRPGEKIPSDGSVVEGVSHVNEALITGESKPVNKKKGDKVVGGSVNTEGVLKIKIERTGEDTYLAQVIKLVKEAQESKSKTQDLANRASALLFYIAVSVGIITYMIWFSMGYSAFALERSVTVLVIACPHALGLAIPLVVAITTTKTSISGILIRDRKAFESAKDVNLVVFDKTGTLTLGEFGITDIVSHKDEKELLRFAAALEINSEHIIAKAIVKYTKEKNIQIPKVKQFKYLPGKGLYGNVEGHEVYSGGPNLLKELKITVPDLKIKKLMTKAKTLAFTVVDGKILGAFGLSDKIRKESYDAVKKLKALGIKVYMITGDSEGIAKEVSNELGIDDYFAQVLPEEKASKIESLKKGGYKVAMVGDGINDAPALVTADVGIAIGAGMDVAIESADIVLVKNNAKDVVKIIDFSRKAYKKMVQNLWWAAGYNIFAIPLAAGILAGIGFIISPAIGAILMSLSTVIVALNSQTLRRYTLIE